MFLNLVKIALFLIVNTAGFFCIPVMMNIAIMTDLLPRLPPGPLMESFRIWLGGGGMWVWIASAVASVGSFYTKGELRAWLLLAPLYATALYGLGVMIYFSFV